MCNPFNPRARFIVFEGLDGCGKTTQLKMLSERLSDHPHIRTREPSDGAIGRLIRESVSGGAQVGPLAFNSETLALLFAADRVKHISDEVMPALRSGKTVLCDRYYYSNIAYQSDGADTRRLFQYNAYAMKTAKPDLVLFIDIPPEECFQRLTVRRAEEKENLTIFENIEKLRLARERYMEIFGELRETENIVTINASGLSAEKTAEQIWERINHHALE